jgi:TP901 family phage tail tape measure protein
VADTKRVDIGIYGQDHLSPTLNKLGTAMGGASGAAKNVALAAGAAAVGGIAALTAGSVEAVSTFTQFEKALSGVAAVSGLYKEAMSSNAEASAAAKGQMQALHDLDLKLGKDTVFSAREAAQGMEELVKGGVSVQDVLNGAAAATLNLAAAGEVSLPKAAEIASNSMAMFGIKGDGMAHVADLIAGAANASSLSVTDFGYSLQMAGAMAAQVGLSFDDTAQAIAVLGQMGLKGSDAGTSLKTFLANLQPRTKDDIALFKELGLMQEQLITGANKTGNAFFDAQGKVKGMAEIAGLLQDALKDMSSQEQADALYKMFGSDAIRAASIFAKQGAEGFREMADAMSKVTAEEVATARLDNLAGSIEQMKGSAETLAIMFGERLAPGVRVAVDEITGFLNKLMESPDAMAAVAGVGDAFGSAVQGVLNAISGAQDAVSGLVSWYQSLDATQQTAIGGFAAGATAALALTAVIVGLGPPLVAAIAGFAALTVAMGPISLAIVGIAAVAGLLGAAWATNFLDIQTHTANALSAIQTFGAAIMAGDWQTAFSGWGEAASGASQAIADEISGLSTGVAGWFDEMANAALGWVGELTGSVIAGVQSFIDGVIAAGAQLVADVARWAEPFVTWSADVLRIGRIIATFYALEFLELLGQMVAPLVAWTVDRARDLSQWVSDAWNAASGFLGGYWSGFSAWLASVVGPVAAWAGDRVRDLSQWVNDAWTAASGFLAAFWGSLAEWLSTTASSIAAAVTEWVTALSEWAGQVWVSVHDYLKTLALQILGWVSDTASSLATAALRLGGQLVDGFVTGIQNNVGRAVGAIQSWAESVVKAAQDKYKIESPSKVFYEIGVNVMQGFIDGIDAKLSDVIDAVTDLGETTIDTANAVLQNAPSRRLRQVGEDLVYGLSAGVYAATPDAVAAVTTMATTAINTAKRKIGGMGRVAEELGMEIVDGVTSGLKAHGQTVIDEACKTGHKAVKQIADCAEHEAPKAMRQATEAVARETRSHGERELGAAGRAVGQAFAKAVGPEVEEVLSKGLGKMTTARLEREIQDGAYHYARTEYRAYMEELARQSAYYLKQRTGLMGWDPHRAPIPVYNVAQGREAITSWSEAFANGVADGFPGSFSARVRTGGGLARVGQEIGAQLGQTIGQATADAYVNHIAARSDEIRRRVGGIQGVDAESPFGRHGRGLMSPYEADQYPYLSNPQAQEAMRKRAAAMQEEWARIWEETSRRRVGGLQGIDSFGNNAAKQFGEAFVHGTAAAAPDIARDTVESLQSAIRKELLEAGKDAGKEFVKGFREQAKKDLAKIGSALMPPGTDYGFDSAPTGKPGVGPGGAFNALMASMRQMSGGQWETYLQDWLQRLGMGNTTFSPVGGKTRDEMMEWLAGLISTGWVGANGWRRLLNFDGDLFNHPFDQGIERAAGPAPKRGLAEGGIVRRPILTWIGEGWESEAVAPLSDLKSYIRGAVSEGGGGAQVVHQTWNVNTTLDLERLADRVAEKLGRRTRSLQLSGGIGVS